MAGDWDTSATDQHVLSVSVQCPHEPGTCMYKSTYVCIQYTEDWFQAVRQEVSRGTRVGGVREWEGRTGTSGSTPPSRLAI